MLTPPGIQGYLRAVARCLEAFLNAVSNVPQDAAKTGKPLDAIKLHECQCPPCFTEFMNSDGSIDCKPKCDLDTCDERTGICQGGFGGSGGELASPLARVHGTVVSE